MPSQHNSASLVHLRTVLHISRFIVVFVDEDKVLTYKNDTRVFSQKAYILAFKSKID